MFDALAAAGFQIEFHSHAQAILAGDFPEVEQQLLEILAGATIPIEELILSGGGETKGTQRLRRALQQHGWHKHKFEIRKTINGIERESISHEVDHVIDFPQGTLALEIEWNNKDPFFDRDLENFKRLHADGAISVGLLITRGTDLQDRLRSMVRRYAEQQGLSGGADLARIGLSPTRRQQAEYDRRVRGGSGFADAWATAFVQDKFGAATTHWRKLADRVRRGVGNPCPLVLIGLPSSLVTFNEISAPLEKPFEEEDDSIE